MAPQYTLTYANGRGLAEPIRLLLAHANIEYVDKRIDMQTEWPSLKPNTFGKVPILQHGDFSLSQSHAILRYLARRHGYAGDSGKESAEMDELVGTMSDLRQESLAVVFEKDPVQKQIREKKLKEEIFPYYLAKFNKRLGTTQKYFVSNKISYADFVIANYFDKHCQDLLEDFPALKAHCKTVLEAPGVKEWIARRPVTDF